MSKPMTRQEWLSYLEQIWDAAQKEAWSEQPRREWVGLEEWELSNVYFDATGQGLRLQDKTLVYKFARAIEAKLKEKNA